MNFVFYWARLLLLTSMVGVLTSCGSAPTKPAPINANLLPVKPAPLPYDKVTQQQEPLRSESAIYAASAAIENKQYALAESFILLSNLNVTNRALHNEAIQLATAALPYTENLSQLSAWFDAIDSNQLLGAEPQTLLHFYATRNFLEQNYYEAAKFGIQISKVAATPASDEQLWRSLRAIPLDNIQALASQFATTQIDTTWLELAAAFADNGSGLQQQASAISAWQIRWPNHRANTYIADTSALIKQHANNLSAAAVAVIPLTGRLRSAGLAARDAILAAHLQRPQFSKLSFVDSALYNSTEELINVINQTQADIIIGPIDKVRAQALATDTTLRIPVVTLNTFAADNGTQNGYQIGLNIEDEAEHIGAKAAKNAKRALVMTADSSLAARSASAFVKSWLRREDASVKPLTLGAKTEFSKQIADSLLLNEYEQRQTNIENIFAERMEANPRRRQDIDLIFLSATAKDARAINPLIAYHYAGDLTVMAPSIVFDGQSNSVANRDLTGIVFADTPWAIHSTNDKRSLGEHASRGGSRSKNLHALAMDAYFIAAQIGIFDGGMINSFNGRTGTLLLFPDGSSKRVPTTAKITSNNLQPIDRLQLENL